MDTTNAVATNQESPVLGVGATGKTGRRVARRLASHGVPTRNVSRSSSPAFDWNRPETWDPVLEGISAIYINYAPDLAIPGAVQAIHGLVEKAVDAGAQRLVLLSGRGEEEARACERVVQSASIEWTIVRASWFYQNFSEGAFQQMVLDGTIAVPAGDVPEPFIDADDIADVVTASLTDSAHAFETYDVTGPELLTFGELAERLSRALGREIGFLPVERRNFSETLELAGTPPDYVWLLDYLFGTVLDGRNAYLGDGVQRALGRQPTDFATFTQRAIAGDAWSVPKGTAA